MGYFEIRNCLLTVSRRVFFYVPFPRVFPARQSRDHLANTKREIVRWISGLELSNIYIVAFVLQPRAVLNEGTREIEAFVVIDGQFSRYLSAFTRWISRVCYSKCAQAKGKTAVSLFYSIARPQRSGREGKLVNNPCRKFPRVEEKRTLTSDAYRKQRLCLCI